jgi:GNAT superfamily N-acetyltransferase
MRYRTATREDLPTLAQMRWDFHCEDAANPPNESRDQFLQHCLAVLEADLARGDWTYWLADHEGTIAAHICVYLFHPVPRPDRAHEHYGYMTNVYTRPAYRNQGTGSALMQHVLAWARERDTVFLMVSPSERSIPFYRRAGFTDRSAWMELYLR